MAGSGKRNQEQNRLYMAQYRARKLAENKDKKLVAPSFSGARTSGSRVISGFCNDVRQAALLLGCSTKQLFALLAYIVGTTCIFLTKVNIYSDERIQEHLVPWPQLLTQYRILRSSMKLRGECYPQLDQSSMCLYTLGRSRSFLDYVFLVVVVVVLLQQEIVILNFLEQYEASACISFDVAHFSQAIFAKAIRKVTLGSAYSSYRRAYLAHYNWIRCGKRCHPQGQRGIASEMFSALASLLQQRSLRPSISTLEVVCRFIGPSTKCGKFIQMLVLRQVRCLYPQLVNAGDERLCYIGWGARQQSFVFGSRIIETTTAIQSLLPQF